MKIGISPIGWTNDAIEDLGAHISFDSCILGAARAGFAGMEIGRKFPADPAAIIHAMRELDLVPISRWYSGYLTERDLDAEWPEARAAAEFLSKLGCRVMVYGECGFGPADGVDAPLSKRPASLRFPSYARKLTSLADRLAEMGITLVYHHHMMQPVETSEQIHALMQATGPSVKLLLDTGHLALAGDDYLTVLPRWWDRIGHIHLKDVRVSVLKLMDRRTATFNDGVRLGMFTVPGDGDIDFGPVFDRIARAGYDGWIVVEAEQDPNKANPDSMARIAFDTLEELARMHKLNPERNPHHVR